MNNRDYQNKQKKYIPNPDWEFQKTDIKPGDPKAIGKKHRPQKSFLDFLYFISEASIPFSILAVISMFVFGGLNSDLRFPEIPAFLCFITCFLFLVRSKVKDNFEYLTLIWLFNAIIWTCNFIFLT